MISYPGETLKDCSATSRLLKAVYVGLYATAETSDSPDLSRLLMAKRLAGYLLSSPATSPVILDLGAGRQSVEKILKMLSYSAAGRGKYATLEAKLASTTVITLDIATNAARRKPHWISHLIADSAALPIAEQSIDLVLSNHSVDMLRVSPHTYSTALSESHRVLKTDGTVLLNLHHADLFDERSHMTELSGRDGIDAQYYSPHLPNPFYRYGEHIETDLAVANLETGSINLQTDGHDKWWSVVAHRLD
jgi:SAM-dependent methyltransferase